MWGEELTCEQVHHHDHHDLHRHDHDHHHRHHLEQDVWDVFGNYIGQKVNKAGVKVERTPWCDGNMSRETSLIADKLSQVQLFFFNSISNISPCPQFFSCDSAFNISLTR